MNPTSWARGPTRCHADLTRAVEITATTLRRSLRRGRRRSSTCRPTGIDFRRWSGRRAADAPPPRPPARSTHDLRRDTSPSATATTSPSTTSPSRSGPAPSPASSARTAPASRPRCAPSPASPRRASGRTTIGGVPYPQLPNPGRVVGVMLDAAAQHPGRTGLETLRLASMLLGLPRGAADEMLERVGLHGAGRRRVGNYSLGMRQRLGIGTALLGDPEVLILDEPANGMDPEGIRWMRHLLQDFAAGGGTVLLSSHLLGRGAGDRRPARRHQRRADRRRRPPRRAARRPGHVRPQPRRRRRWPASCAEAPCRSSRSTAACASPPPRRRSGASPPPASTCSSSSARAAPTSRTCSSP